MVAPVDGPTTTTTTTVTPTARADAEGVDGAGAAAKDDVVFDTDDGGGEPAGVGGHGGAGGLKFVRSVARLLATNPEYMRYRSAVIEFLYAKQSHPLAA